MGGTNSYDLFFSFIDAYLPTGFRNINPDDPLVRKLEEKMEQQQQFFFAGDLLKMQIQYTSKRSFQMIGVEPENVTPHSLTISTHPDDAVRMGLGMAKLFKMGSELLIQKKGESLLSTTLKLLNPEGGYSNTLFQCYLFYATIPYKSVFEIQVHTNVDGFKINKNGNHYYVGNDLTNFRYPDEELLSQGKVFSDREFEIISMIASGMSSEEISKILFLSVHTVNTHRRNILQKTGKENVSEVIYALMEKGLL